MGKNYFYNSTSDANLAKELMAGCSNLFIQRHEYSGLATLTLVPGGNDTLELVDGGIAGDDDYNSSVADNLYIIDDNGVCSRGKIIDTFSESTGTLIEFEADDMILISDGTTAPTLTDGETYTVLVLSGSNTNEFGDYFGYTDDSVEFDPTPETEALEICNEEGQMEEVAENVTKRALTLNGSTYNVPNSDVVKRILSMETYGLNTVTHKEYHGGFSPDVSSAYQVTAKMKDWDGNHVAVQIFKVQLMNNGAWGMSGTGWKTISFTAKGKKDSMRDTNKVNGFRILIWS